MGDSWCLIQNLPSTKREFLRLIDGLLIFFWGWIELLFLLHDFTLGQREHGAPVYVVNMDASHSTSNNPFCKDISRKGFFWVDFWVHSSNPCPCIQSLCKVKSQLQLNVYCCTLESSPHEHVLCVCWISQLSVLGEMFWKNLQVNQNTGNLGISEKHPGFQQRALQTFLSRCWWDLQERNFSIEKTGIDLFHKSSWESKGTRNATLPGNRAFFFTVYQPPWSLEIIP